MSKHATLQIDPDRPFRILQVTDFHNDAGAEAAAQTYAAVRNCIARCQPDLLAVTGDIWCSDDAPELAAQRMDADLVALASLGVPWCFAWGNHDYLGNFEEDQRKIAAARHAVYPRGDGKGNYRVELRAGSETLPRWDLYFLNSRQWWTMPEDMAWFQQEAARLLEARRQQIPSIIYFHIPLGNYKRAMEEGRAIGIAIEEVMCWGDEEEVGAEIVKAAPGVRACFCGHNHMDDFYFRENGIVFSFGRCTGYGGYGGEEVARGAKLLELDPGSDRFNFFTVLPDGSDNPDPNH